MGEAVSYRGWRRPGSVGRGTVFIERQDASGEWTELPRRIVHHSPDGFEFGYGGSGPSDLALNILADVAGFRSTWRHDSAMLGFTPDTGLPEWVWRLHNDFKFAFLADPRMESFTISRGMIVGWLAAQDVILAESADA